MKVIMSGNEAIARGAYEGGARFASAYPGTPSTEILENMPQYGESVYSEWAPNEKVATEAAIGASIAGVRSFCAMKHVGLNVAADPIYTFAYTGVTGGFVIVVADDPGQHLTLLRRHQRVIVQIQAAHGRQGTGFHTVGVKRFIADGIYFQGVEKNPHGIVGRLRHFRQTDSAEGAVIHPRGHSGPETLIDGVKKRVLQPGSKGLKGVMLRRKTVQQRQDRIRKPGRCNQPGTQAGTKCVLNLLCSDHITWPPFRFGCRYCTIFPGEKR